MHPSFPTPRLHTSFLHRGSIRRSLATPGIHHGERGGRSRRGRLRFRIKLVSQPGRSPRQKRVVKPPVGSPRLGHRSRRSLRKGPLTCSFAVKSSAGILRSTHRPRSLGLRRCDGDPEGMTLTFGPRDPIFIPPALKYRVGLLGVRLGKGPLSLTYPSQPSCLSNLARADTRETPVPSGKTPPFTQKASPPGPRRDPH